MKKITILFCLFIAFSSYSQSEKEMLDAGIKKGTVKKIFKSFSGDINIAIDRWAVTGSGKLSKKFIKSAEKLGIDKKYLGQKLKDARKVRMTAIAAGLSGAAAGYAASQPKATPVNSNSKKSSYSNPGGYSTDGAYSNPGGNSNYVSSPTYVSPTYVSPTYNSGNSETIVYGKDQYGFDKEAGKIKDNGYGGTTIYGKDQYGFDKEVGKTQADGYGGTTIYGKDQYGFDKEVGKSKDNGYGETIVYGKDQYGFDKEVRKYVKNSSGTFDIMEKDSYGFWKKVGSISKIPN